METLQQAGSSQQVGIWVTGQGSVSATPDVANLTVGIESKSSTVYTAHDKATTAMSAVVDELSSNGISERDIRTQFFNISPEYRYQKDQTPKIIGYRVTNTVQAKIRDINKLGPIIDRLVKAGGDLIRIQGIRFELENQVPLLKQARENAMLDAETKASQLAQLGGVVLGKPTFISEGGGPQSPFKQEMRAFAASAPARDTPISPGETQVDVSVQVVYSIR